MSNCSRRDFIKTSGSIIVGAALGGLTLSCHNKEVSPSEWSGFRYAMCNESMAELSWAQQCQIASNAGYKGIEIAAFTLVKEGVPVFIGYWHRHQKDCTLPHLMLLSLKKPSCILMNLSTSAVTSTDLI